MELKTIMLGNSIIPQKQDLVVAQICNQKGMPDQVPVPASGEIKWQF